MRFKILIHIPERVANLKNYRFRQARFVLFLTIGSLVFSVGCASHLSKIEGKNIAIQVDAGSSEELEKIITPYREKIDADMNKVLAYAPETIDKSGRWQTPIGNLFADITLESAQNIFSKRYPGTVDLCMLNAGGVRSFITKGPVTTRTAYEIMPFENQLIVVELGPSEMQELIDYLVADKKPHPLSGMHLSKNADGSIRTEIQGKLLDPTASYRVATSDYLYNGGDKMTFFKKGRRFDVDYKLRNVWIDYLQKTDTVKADRSTRIDLP